MEDLEDMWSNQTIENDPDIGERMEDYSDLNLKRFNVFIGVIILFIPIYLLLHVKSATNLAIEFPMIFITGWLLSIFSFIMSMLPYIKQTSQKQVKNYLIITILLGVLAYFICLSSIFASM